jgi:hypothetical protein
MVEFLKRCEAQIDAIPAAFVGLGSDPLLAEFLQDDRWRKAFDVADTKPEMLPELARIGADHWLSKIEDLRYHLDWILHYSKPPSKEELYSSTFSDAEKQRPAIRVRFAITGNRETDLQQYRKTLLSWSSRDDIRNYDLARYAVPYSARLKRGKSTRDPITDEKTRGEFLQQVSSLWRYLSIAAADRGNIDEAIRMIRRDLERRSASSSSSRYLGDDLVYAGRFDDAWQAYREHFLGEPAFDAFELRQSSPWMELELVVGGGPGAWAEFDNFPEIRRHIDEWVAMTGTVNGLQLEDLGQVSETLSSDWFKQLDDFSKLRVLYYYGYTRPRDHEGPDLAKQVDEFTAALHTSKEAEAIWARATAKHSIDPPL